MSSRMIEILLLILILHKVRVLDTYETVQGLDTHESLSYQSGESWIHMKLCHTSPANPTIKS